MPALPPAPLNLLAFDTSTETLSVALQAGAGAPLGHVAPGGAQASATLIPCIQALLAQAGLSLRALDAIAFGRGPGSFTGLRTACAVAQGLAFGADRPLLALDTLLAVAEEARAQGAGGRIVALLDARMGEVYAARYAHEGGAWRVLQPPWLGAPEAVAAEPGEVLAGNAFAALGDRLPAGVPRAEVLPTATALLRLAPAALAAGQAVAAADALPLYIRDKVAQTTAEREQARAVPARANAPDR